MKIDKVQKKLIIYIGAIVFVAVLLFIFVYLPKAGEAKRLKVKLDGINAGIENIRRIIGEASSLDVVIGQYNNKIKEIKATLPVREESVLRDLAASAVKMDIDVSSVTSGMPQLTKLPVDVQGYICEELQITMVIAAPYRRIGEFLDFLENEFKVVIKINSISISKEVERKDKKINIELQLTLYMVSEKEA